MKRYLFLMIVVMLHTSVWAACVDDVTDAFAAFDGCDKVINNWGMGCDQVLMDILISGECPLSCDTCPDYITITAPNGGENWEIGSVQTIDWTSQVYGM